MSVTTIYILSAFSIICYPQLMNNLQIYLYCYSHLSFPGKMWMGSKSTSYSTDYWLSLYQQEGVYSE